MGKGLGIGFLLHFCQLPLIAIVFGIAGAMPGKQGEGLGYGAIAAPFFIGLTQLVYMIPAILVFRRRQPQVAKGIAIVAAVTFLLNASCFGLIWISSRKWG